MIRALACPLSSVHCGEAHVSACVGVCDSFEPGSFFLTNASRQQSSVLSGRRYYFSRRTISDGPQVTCPSAGDTQTGAGDLVEPCHLGLASALGRKAQRRASCHRRTCLGEGRTANLSVYSVGRGTNPRASRDCEASAVESSGQFSEGGQEPGKRLIAIVLSEASGSAEPRRDLARVRVGHCLATSGYSVCALGAGLGHCSLQSHQARMLRPLGGRLEISRSVKEAPYVDPLIKRDVLKLAVRMAKAGMLRAAGHCHSTVGLFTVVKKVLDKDEIGPTGEVLKPAGTVILRPVLDQRVPNLLWQDPPWVALGGPGALSSLDLGRFSEGGESACIMMATWDVPDYYYRLGWPPAFSEWFCLPGVELSSLCGSLVSEGRSDLASDLMRSAPDARYVGLVAPAMGWSWAVFLAQSALQDLTHGIRVPSGISP